MFDENHSLRIDRRWKLCVDGHKRHDIGDDERAPKPRAHQSVVEHKFSELSLGEQKKIKWETEKKKDTRDKTPETKVKKADGNEHDDTDIEDLSGADTEVWVSSDSDNTIIADDDDDDEPRPKLTRQNAMPHLLR